MEIDWRIYLKEDDIKIFGKGPRTLLLKIEEKGSIRKAASSMNLSYTKALNMIEVLEKGLGIKVLEKHIGGKDGGGSVLTAEIKEFIAKFDVFENEVENCITDLYDKQFKGALKSLKK